MQNEKLLVYLYNSEGMHFPAIIINGDHEQIASIIVQSRTCPKIEITTLMDEFVLSTMYGFLDRCFDMDFRNGLMEFLLPLQLEDKQPLPIEVAWEYWSSFLGKINQEECLGCLKENLGINLTVAEEQLQLDPLQEEEFNL